MMHTIDQVNIGMSRRAEHDLGACGPAARRVRGKVMGAKIRLGLDDAAHSLLVAEPVDQELAQKFWRHELGITVVEGSGQYLHGFHHTRQSLRWRDRSWLGIVQAWRQSWSPVRELADRDVRWSLL